MVETTCLELGGGELVHALGTLGVDFGNEARREAFQQAIAAAGASSTAPRTSELRGVEIDADADIRFLGSPGDFGQTRLIEQAVDNFLPWEPFTHLKAFDAEIARQFHIGVAIADDQRFFAEPAGIFEIVSQ